MFKINLKDRHKRILFLIKENRFKLFLAMLCMLVIAAASSATAFLVKPVLDDIFFNKNTTMLKLIPLAVVVIYLLRGLGMYGQDYLMNYVGESIIQHLRNDLYARIQDLPIAFFHREKTGVLMSRITNDVNIIKTMVSTAVTGSLPVAFFPVVEFGKRVRRISTGCQEAMADLNTFLHETFAGNKIVKAFGMESYEKERFFNKTLKLFKLEMSAVVARSLSSPVMEFLGGLGIAFIIWYGGYQVITGSSTAGTFFSFMAAVLMLYDPVKKLSGLNNAVQQGLAAADRIFDIIETESDIKEKKNSVRIEKRSHRVTFENVYFKYDDVMVLKDINLDVNADEILALVGMSGGGKTSLVNLIPRFYDVTRGAIRIDGMDIQDASISSLRDQMGIVTQEPILFNDSIRNNIAYGKKDATDKAIIAAAEAAYAHDFIQAFPNKYDTNIGELGGRLSGGEKQRICIARALLKDAPILILDEATSSLDTESEMLVQKALENLMKGRTTFVIAHRLSTIDYADRIIVIVDGRIVEEGKQEDLISMRGEFFKLYQMQYSNDYGQKVQFR
jgi:subfamily B ATP-binding cassette protein MsbA